MLLTRCDLKEPQIGPRILQCRITEIAWHIGKLRMRWTRLEIEEQEREKAVRKNGVASQNHNLEQCSTKELQ